MEKKEENFISFLTPDFIYVPFDTIDKLSLRKNRYVYNGECIGNKTEAENIYVTVSGMIKGSVKIKNSTKEEMSLAIENDYRDKKLKLVGGKSKYDTYKRKEANEILEKYNLGRKYNSKRYLFVNFLISNKDIENRYIASNYAFEILECIDSLLTIYGLEKAYIIINDKYTEMNLKRYSRMYPNIDYIRRIVKNESGVYYSGYEIFEVYNALKYDRYVNEKFITVVNNKGLRIVNTKLNVITNELLNYLNIEALKVSALNNNNELIVDYKNGLISKQIKSIIINN